MLIQIGLQSSNELSFVSLGVQTSGLALLPQLSKLKQVKQKLFIWYKVVPNKTAHSDMCEFTTCSGEQYLTYENAKAHREQPTNVIYIVYILLITLICLSKRH